MIKGIRYYEILDDPNAAELLKQYAAECSLPELGETHPQREMYSAMEASGMMRAFGAYEHGQLVGFATVLFYVVPHYGCKVCTVESVFVAQVHRGAMGRELMARIEEYAKNRGCKAILYSAPTDSRLEKLLKISKPYRQSNTTFIRSL